MTRIIPSTGNYFLEEGKSNLADCVRLSFEAAIEHGIETLLVFTGGGDGLKLARELRSENPNYEGIRLIGITFPQGLEYGTDGKPSGISKENQAFFRQHSMSILRAHLPFDPIPANFKNHSILGQDLALIRNALGIFGGGMSLCVQAALIACDAGEVQDGEHVIAMSADTSILVRCAPTTRFLTDFIVREILCKPIFLTISKGEELQQDETEDAQRAPLLEAGLPSDDEAEGALGV